MRIIDYIVVSDIVLTGRFQGLAYEVREKIKEGYQPWGDVENHAKEYHQFMVKYEQLSEVKP